MVLGQDPQFTALRRDHRALDADWFHRFWNGLRGTQARDLFSTTYACNQPEAVRQAAERHGFDVATLDVIEGRPEYLRVAAPLYLCGFSMNASSTAGNSSHATAV